MSDPRVSAGSDDRAVHPAGGRPEVTVVIPAFQAEQTIVKCLESIRRQTVPPVEIIVVDDGSTDRTRQLAEPLATVLMNTRAKGAGGARNTGGLAARGVLLAFTDSDCVVGPTWLANIVQAFDDPTVGAVAGGYGWTEERGFMGQFAFLELVRRRRHFPDTVSTAASNNFATRTTLFRELGGFPEDFPGATLEDMILSFRVGQRATILWLRSNGVGHHFPATIGDYLHQQYTFARDTVLAYKRLPDLRRVKTHQGRLIYLETLVSGLTVLALVRPWPWLLAGLALIWIMNVPLIADQLVIGPAQAFKAFLFIPVRNFNWVRGVAAGVLRASLLPQGPRSPG